jgi:hypothetical protein
MSNKLLRCPACQFPLGARSDLARFERSDEHISDPNGERPLRPVITCPNLACEAHRCEVFWADDGEGPYNTRYNHPYKWIDDNPGPFNSPERAMHFSIYYDKEDRSFNCHRFRIYRRVRYNSNDYGDKCNRVVTYSLCLRHRNGGYFYYTPGVKMLWHSLREFYAQRGYGWYSPRTLLDRAAWPRAEWWRKVAAWWVKTFHAKYLEVK